MIAVDPKDERVLKRIGRNITKARGTRSRYWLGKQTGLATIQITRIEEARHKYGADVLVKIADVLGVSLDDLAGRKKLNNGG